MIDELSIVETDKVNHTVETDMMKLVVKIECFGVNFNEFDKETGSSDELQPKQADLNCVHALNEPHLHEIHVVPNKHEADRCTDISNITRKPSKTGKHGHEKWKSTREAKDSKPKLEKVNFQSTMGQQSQLTRGQNLKSYHFSPSSFQKLHKWSLDS
ncbi:hypothetical protein Tco_0893346 [Tanacetum coccineum]|uniref:Uncharacterized protein n=1 Tax=Tanacetum coccineum TaxID=301880 RepID=A0ABQ5CEU9_9ASTR